VDFLFPSDDQICKKLWVYLEMKPVVCFDFSY